jgi:hypothetical protein
MFLTGLVMVLSKSSRDEIILTANNHTVLLGLISLLVGLPIIILHNIWVGPWEIVVTLMGWLTVLKGVVRMLNNPKTNKLREKSMSDSRIVISAWVSILLGCVMMYGAYS